MSDDEGPLPRVALALNLFYTRDLQRVFLQSWSILVYPPNGNEVRFYPPAGAPEAAGICARMQAALPDLVGNDFGYSFTCPNTERDLRTVLETFIRVLGGG